MPDWDNLKLRKCPLCGHKLLKAHYYMRCSQRRGGVYKVKQKSVCTFTIRKGRYKELGGLINPSEKDDWVFKTDDEMEEHKDNQDYQERVRKEVKKIKRKAKKARYWKAHPEKLAEAIQRRKERDEAKLLKKKLRDEQRTKETSQGV